LTSRARRTVVKQGMRPAQKIGWYWFCRTFLLVVKASSQRGLERGSLNGRKCARGLLEAKRLDAGVVELVDAPDSKSGSARIVGSSPTTRTTLHIEGCDELIRALARQDTAETPS
jgi:hypothetical protein